jgi:hypothetical protein
MLGETDGDMDWLTLELGLIDGLTEEDTDGETL